jgi:hypothetical protein
MATTSLFDRSGVHDRHDAAQRVIGWRLAGMAAFAAMPLFCACSGPGRTPGAASRAPESNLAGDSNSACRPGDASCPIPVQLGSDPQWLEGSLTPGRPSQSYRFCVAQPASLTWQWRGAAVHLVLQDPSGDAWGPGLPNPVSLPVEGCYRLGVSADTMADEAFGGYRLSLRLSPRAHPPGP